MSMFFNPCIFIIAFSCRVEDHYLDYHRRTGILSGLDSRWASAGSLWRPESSVRRQKCLWRHRCCSHHQGKLGTKGRGYEFRLEFVDNGEIWGFLNQTMPDGEAWYFMDCEGWFSGAGWSKDDKRSGHCDRDRKPKQESGGSRRLRIWNVSRLGWRGCSEDGMLREGGLWDQHLSLADSQSLLPWIHSVLPETVNTMFNCDWPLWKYSNCL